MKLFKLGIIEIGDRSVRKFNICKSFYRKVLLFETNSLQNLTNLNVLKYKNVCVVAPLMTNMKYCCCINIIKNFLICDI